jgi:hypothetical protein
MLPEAIPPSSRVAFFRAAMFFIVAQSTGIYILMSDSPSSDSNGAG